MNKKSHYLLILLLAIGSMSFAQSTAELKDTALRDAKIYCKAKQKLDHETVIKHTHPLVIAYRGGSEKAKTSLKTSYDTFRNTKSMAYEKSDVKMVSDVIEESGEYRCYVECFDQIKRDNSRTKSKNYLIGSYDANANIWTFFNARQLKGEMGSITFKDFKTKMDIPNDEVVRKRLK